MSIRRSHGTTSKITLRRPYFTLPRCVSMDLVQHAWELRVRTSAMHKIQQLGSSCHVFDPLTWRACRLRRGGSPIQPDLSHCSFKLPQKSAVQPTLRIAMDLAWRKKRFLGGASVRFSGCRFGSFVAVTVTGHSSVRLGPGSSPAGGALRPPPLNYFQ